MQDKARFYRGQVVALKSGGPEMTVDEVRDEDGCTTCVWFHSESSSELLSGMFYAETLHLIGSDHPDAEFVPGQIVQLRSTGPLMTVESVRNDGYTNHVTCIWFGDRGRASTLSSANVHPNSLVLID
ncbi:DUF2158 domain-containing protein [Aeromonas veronii]|uniref:DUF2158 domain-containing protein n=1 Tax=Aeromonas veronii TaxID=654 RepID=UPI0009BD96A8|nr:DUF2158 domain-containing protein [Aeromonas veronii]